MELQTIGSFGLAIGFVTYLLAVSGIAPAWWYRFVEWWKLSSPFKTGKPFTCELCSSFWFSAAAYVYACCVSGPSLYLLLMAPIYIFSISTVALLISKIFDRLSTIYVSKQEIN